MWVCVIVEIKSWQTRSQAPSSIIPVHYKCFFFWQVVYKSATIYITECGRNVSNSQSLKRTLCVCLFTSCMIIWLLMFWALICFIFMMAPCSQISVITFVYIVNVKTVPKGHSWELPPLLVHLSSCCFADVVYCHSLTALLLTAAGRWTQWSI